MSKNLIEAALTHFEQLGYKGPVQLIKDELARMRGDTVQEYIEARNAYEAATRPPNSHAQAPVLKHSDPVMLRYHSARAALTAAYTAPASVAGGTVAHVIEWLRESAKACGSSEYGQGCRDAMNETAEKLAAIAQQPTGVGLLSPDDVQWVVNDLAELGVRIGDQCFFLYKGSSIVYEDARHENGQPMHIRTVGKREFGECCHPINREDPTRIGTVSLDDSDRWEVLPAAAPKPAAADDDTAEALRFLLTRIGSWTSARWDQHLRHEFGDERAERMIAALDGQQQGVRKV